MLRYSKQQLNDIDTLLDLLSGISDKVTVQQWMMKPIPQLSNQTPAHLVQRGETKILLDFIKKLHHQKI